MKGKQGKNRNVQKAHYRFNRAVLSSIEYSNYFNPDPEVEDRILGLSELVCGRVPYLIGLTVHIQKTPFKTPRQPLVSTVPGVPSFQHAQVETQTQDESQILASLSLSDISPKRSNTPPNIDGTRRPKKRIKISVAHAVDLAE